ncbi:MAG: cell division protein FtsK, partial [Desulfobulbaceae bacterium]|nr:cell division protein FtsK [Desulfobulbaceae bacterium]
MAQKNAIPKPGLRQEALAVLGIFVGVFLYLSLISYSLKTAGNWCGEIGLLIAQALFGFTGWGAYLLPALLLLSSFLFFSPRMSFARLPQLMSGLTGAIISFCGLLSSLTIKDPKYLESGGFLGKTGFTLLNSVVGHGGTVLVFIMVFLISLMLSTQFSPYQVLSGLWGLMKRSFVLFVKNPEKPKERKQQRSNGTTKKSIEKQEPPLLAPQVLQTITVPVVKAPARAAKTAETDEDFAANPIARGDWKLPPL